MTDRRRESYALHKAIEYRNMHKIKILLPKTKDVNKKNENGYSAFLLACETDNENILDAFLVRKDIDITATNEEVFTALHILAFRGNFNGLVKVLDAFPEADINAINDKGNTPLIMACKMNHVKIVEYLLGKGADVRHKNEKRYTALHYAANNGYTECAVALIKNGAEVDAKDDYGFTPLMKASKWGFIDTCELLLKNGANVNVSSKHMTPLTSACFNNVPDLVKLLISHGADVHFSGPISNALIECARRGSLECAEELIKAGADASAMQRNGKRAVDFARENGHQDLVRLLSK